MNFFPIGNVRPHFSVNLGSRVAEVRLQGAISAQVADFTLFSRNDKISDWPAVPLVEGRLVRPLSSLVSPQHSLTGLRLGVKIGLAKRIFFSSPTNTSYVRAAVSGFSADGTVVQGWVSLEKTTKYAPLILEVSHAFPAKSAVLHFPPLTPTRDAQLKFFSLALHTPARKGDLLTLRLGSEAVGHYRVPRGSVVSKGPAIPVIRKQAHLLDSQQNPRVWVIGNGPSVRTEDLEKIPRYDTTFAFNRFHLSYGDHSFRPNFVAVVDRGMVTDFGEEITRKSEARVLIANSFITPLHYLRLKSAGHCRIRLRRGESVFQRNGREFSEAGAVIYVALQAAFAMKAKEIVLYGIDFDFTLGSFRQKAGRLTVDGENNHFIKNYRSGKDWFPPSWPIIGDGMLNAAVTAFFEGVQIMNASRGGKLETFERVDFDTVVKS